MSPPDVDSDPPVGGLDVVVGGAVDVTFVVVDEVTLVVVVVGEG